MYRRCLEPCDHSECAISSLISQQKRLSKGSLRLFVALSLQIFHTILNDKCVVAWHPQTIKKSRMLCLTEASFYTLQLHITVSPDKVKINVDCQEVAERPVKAANNITLDGYEVLGKMVRSGGGRRQSATVSE